MRRDPNVWCNFLSVFHRPLSPFPPFPLPLFCFASDVAHLAGVASVADAHGLDVPQLQQRDLPVAARRAEDAAAVAAMVLAPRDAEGLTAPHARGSVFAAHPFRRDSGDGEPVAARDVADLAPQQRRDGQEAERERVC
jgi:hypothetical protein